MAEWQELSFRAVEGPFWRREERFLTLEVWQRDRTPGWRARIWNQKERRKRGAGLVFVGTFQSADEAKAAAEARAREILRADLEELGE